MTNTATYDDENEESMGAIPHFRCSRCEHEWMPRIPDPLKCPRCQSPHWDEEPSSRQAER
jgi:predicted Zn-ribbon and HTH transcriptional regulator